MNLTVQAYPSATNYKPVFKNQALKKAAVPLQKEPPRKFFSIVHDDIARATIKRVSCYMPELFFANKLTCLFSTKV